MIKNIGILALFFISCQSQDSEYSITGDWKVYFSAFDEIRNGDIKLKADHTGIMSIENDPESLLINGDEEFNFDWTLTNDEFILKRHDNNFILNYKLKSISEDQIAMLFNGEVQVLLFR